MHPRAHPDPKKPKNRVYYHEKGAVAYIFLTESNRCEILPHPAPVSRSPVPFLYFLGPDILFMMHEPVLDVMRKAKSHGKKIKRARGKKDYTGLLRLLRSKVRPACP